MGIWTCWWYRSSPECFPSFIWCKKTTWGVKVWCDWPGSTYQQRWDVGTSPRLGPLGLRGWHIFGGCRFSGATWKREVKIWRLGFATKTGFPTTQIWDRFLGAWVKKCQICGPKISSQNLGDGFFKKNHAYLGEDSHFDEYVSIGLKSPPSILSHYIIFGRLS